MNSGDHDQAALIAQASEGDRVALAGLFSRHRARLRRAVELRMDRRLRGRVDPSDVLQEAFMDLSEKLPEYQRKESLPFFLWLRLVTLERLLRIHRRHLGAAMRAANREVSLHPGSVPHVDSASLAVQLTGKLSSPSQVAVRAELRSTLEDAIDQLDPKDREVISLRHFEELSNEETARILGLTPAGACKRHTRAMLRLKECLASIPGFSESARGLLR